MNRNALLTVMLTAACLSVTYQANAQVAARPNQIYWAKSSEMALSLARNSRLPILVVVSSKNCSYCRKMDREVWSNPRIIAQVESGFVPLKLNATRHRQLVAKLGVRVFPTTILLSPEGHVINRARGYLPPNKLAGLLRSASSTKVAAHQRSPVE